jgi:hypothetical protein
MGMSVFEPYLTLRVFARNATGILTGQFLAGIAISCCRRSREARAFTLASRL